MRIIDRTRLAPALAVLLTALALVLAQSLVAPPSVAHAQDGEPERTAPGSRSDPAPDSESGPESGSESDSDEEGAESPLALGAIEILPESPGPETLCQLSVEIVNRADEPVTAFGFDVTVAGHELPVYHNQLFLKLAPAGATVELALYNFWVSETGRPAPADGKMPVEITLREARWLKVGEEEGAEVWDLEGEVPGLPVSARTVIDLKSP